MLSFLFFVLSFLTAKSQDVCIWGRTGSNTFMNGEYIYEGDVNGAPYYRKDIDSSWSISTTYLWRYNTNYYFTDYPPGTLASYRAKCIISTSNPIECGLNWRVGSEPSIDIDLLSQYSPCPQWHCDEIISSQSYASCDGPFDVYVGPNVWRNNANTRYWYFHPTYFMWICASTYNLRSSGSYWAYTQSVWTPLPNNSSFVDLNFEAPHTASFKVECIKYNRSSTTTTTTTTTVNPTKSPTKSPTNIPSEIPTVSPTDKPIVLLSNRTILPTYYPTIWPTNNPTNNPINSATNSATNNPTNIHPITTKIFDTNYAKITQLSSSNSANLIFICVGIAIIICCCVPLCCCYCFHIMKLHMRKHDGDEAGKLSRMSAQSSTHTAGSGYRISVKQNHSLAVMEVNKLCMNAGVPEKKKSFESTGSLNTEPIIDFLSDPIELRQYADVFIQNGYVDLCVIKSIEGVDELQNIGIVNRDHQSVLMQKIEILATCPLSAVSSIGNENDEDNIIICYKQTDGNIQQDNDDDDSQQLEIIYNDIVNNMDNIEHDINETCTNGETKAYICSIHQKQLTNMALEGYEK